MLEFFLGIFKDIFIELNKLIVFVIVFTVINGVILTYEVLNYFRGEILDESESDTETGSVLVSEPFNQPEIKEKETCTYLEECKREIQLKRRSVCEYILNDLTRDNLEKNEIKVCRDLQLCLPESSDAMLGSPLISPFNRKFEEIRPQSSSSLVSSESQSSALSHFSEKNDNMIKLDTFAHRYSFTRHKQDAKIENVQEPKTKPSKKSNKNGLFSNETFVMYFDLPTPRPHFIIKFRKEFEDKKNKDEKKTSIEKLDDEEMKSLLLLIEEFRISLNNNYHDFTLSFHTGYWANTASFHAHLCVSTDFYLDLLREKKTNLESFHPTKNWKLEQRGNESVRNRYIKNVINYKKVSSQAAKEYKKKEVAIIKSGVVQELQVKFKNDLVDLIFDQNEPKIYFSLKNCENEKSVVEMRLKLLKTIIHFAAEYDLFARHNGSHICLCLQTPQQVYGYLQLSADMFYQMHPAPHSFLENFEANNNYTILT